MKNIILATMIAMSSAQAAVVDTNTTKEVAKTVLIDTKTTSSVVIDTNRTTDKAKDGNETNATKKMTPGQIAVAVVVAPVYIAGAIVAGVILLPVYIVKSIFGSGEKKK